MDNIIHEVNSCGMQNTGIWFIISCFFDDMLFDFVVAQIEWGPSGLLYMSAVNNG